MTSLLFRLSACLLLVTGACLAQVNICLYPPCPELDTSQQQVQELTDKEAGQPAGQCCSQNRQEMDAIHRNLSALWYTVSEFREVVARHLHHLHEHQVMMFSHQMTGAQPPMHSHQHPHPPPHQHAGNETQQDYQGRRRRYKTSYRSRRPSSRRQPSAPPTVDPFHGLDRAPPPAAFNRPPIVRDTDELDVGICQMRPNTALPDSQVHGQVLLYQRKNSPTLYLHLMLSGFRPSGLHLPLPSMDGPPQVDKHGLHIHEKVDFSDGCDSTGPHYNPQNVAHGGPHSAIRHIGDFGNVASDHEGSMNELIIDEVASLRGEHSLYGKPLVIHALTDDLGSNPNDVGSISTGNSGARLACCVIERVERLESPSAPAVQLQAGPPTDEEEFEEADNDQESQIRQMGALGMNPKDLENL